MLLALAAFTTASLAEADARVATLAWRLQTANVALCSETARLPGFTVHHASQYALAVRRDMRLDDRPAISAVVAESSAARAGLRAGDAISAIEGTAARYPAGGRAHYDAVADVTRRIAEGLADGRLDLTLTDRAVAIAGDRGCVSTVEVVPGARVNAQADGRIVQVWGGLIDFARTDDELAFSVAHELAHNILKHRARLDRIGRSRANSRATELEADRLAVWLIARAGYDVDAVLPYRERLNVRFGRSATHPPPADRLARLAEAVSELKVQRASGRPLLP